MAQQSSAPGGPTTATIDELLAQISEMRSTLSAARAGIPPSFTWYRYDILGNIGHVEALLSGGERDLGRLAQGLPVADIGAADGDLAFALEGAFGWEVDIVDNAPTNQNGLQAAHALKQALGSRVGIHDIDLDSQFRLPRERYGLAFVLGTLYHLQNPFYALRALAEQADHCFVSTKIARFAGTPPVDVSEIPVAYLLDPDECNGDSTNYWIFSRVGLDRIVARAGWDVLACRYAGDVVASDPASPDHDERAFMLLRSRRLA